VNTADPSASSTPSDFDVVQAMARGETPAASVLFGRYGASLYGLALRTVGEPEVAEGVVLDVFAQAWREASRFDDRGGSVPGWLTAITRAAALDQLNARTPRGTETDAEPITFFAPIAAPALTTLRERLQARIAVESGTQNAAQIAGAVATRVTTPTATAAIAAPPPRVPDALDEIRARINAGYAAEPPTATSRAGASAPEPRPTVSRATPTSRAVRVTPLKGGPAIDDSARRRPSRAGWYVSALLAVGLAAASYVAFDLRQRIGLLEAEARKTSAQTTRVEQKLNEKERTLGTLLAGRGNVVLVTLVGPVPTGPGMQVFWNVRDGKAVVNAFGFAQVATDRVYMLWMIRDGQAVPVKPFTPDETGRALLADVELPVTTFGVTQLVVTEEAAQGAGEPTMAPMLEGGVRGES
jgi:DNA-directed RNA polymerase specialized sigma24 family protein